MRGMWSAPTGMTLAGGAAAVVATAAVTAAVFAPPEQVARLVAMAACVAGAGVLGGNLPAALATGSIAWTVLNGFLVNRLGVLTWHGSADAVRLGVLLAAATTGWLAAWARPALRQRRDVVRMRVWLDGDGFASSVHAHKEASPSG
ncbi:hypothetical protein AB0M46_02035 [Dactylosporangium sp. NPDC051485]|uniref:hypothetical protein n=1 Tax=Dactylosporangium sp. NPDC051485 TaxID=3154846 RepID=UPI003433D1D5